MPLMPIILATMVTMVTNDDIDTSLPQAEQDLMATVMSGTSPDLKPTLGEGESYEENWHNPTLFQDSNGNYHVSRSDMLSGLKTYTESNGELTCDQTGETMPASSAKMVDNTPLPSYPEVGAGSGLEEPLLPEFLQPSAPQVAVGSSSDVPFADTTSGPWRRTSAIPNTTGIDYRATEVKGRFPAQTDIHTLAEMNLTVNPHKEDQCYVYISPWSRTTNTGTINTTGWRSAGDLGYTATRNAPRTWNPYFLTNGHAAAQNGTAYTIAPGSLFYIYFTPYSYNSIGGTVQAMKVTTWWLNNTTWRNYTLITTWPTNNRWLKGDLTLARLATIAQRAGELGHTKAHNCNVQFWTSYNYVGGTAVANAKAWGDSALPYRVAFQQYPWQTPQSPWLTKDVVRSPGATAFSETISVDTRVTSDVAP